MAKVSLGRGEATPYGTRYDGKVIDGRRSIPITYRDVNGDTTYINANGLSAGRGTMRQGAIIGARHGHNTVTVDYTNRSPRGCLDANAHDIATVAEAFSDGQDIRGIGLSEGGLVMIRAMRLAKFQAVTLVNAAGIIEDNDMSWAEGLKRVQSVIPEVVGFARKDLVGTLRLGASCILNCAGRPGGVFGEMNELRHGNEHANLEAIKQEPDAPYIRLCWSQGDNLLQAALLEAGARLLPVDDRVSFPGGHCDWATDPVLAMTVYERDAQVFGQPSPTQYAGYTALAAAA